MIIQNRSVKNYFKLRKLAWDLAQFHWDQREADLGKTDYEKYKAESVYKVVEEIDSKADRLYAEDVAHAYWYHIRSKLRKCGGKAKRRKRPGKSKSRR